MEAKARERYEAKRRAKHARQMDVKRALRGRGPRFHVLTLYQIARYRSPDVICLDVDAEGDLKAAAGAYIGSMSRKKDTLEEPPPKLLSLEWCMQQGYRVIGWSGE